jgi:large subunit ribosomal protein L21
MEKYAIIKSGNKQFLVSVGQTLLVDKIASTEGAMAFDQILLIKDKNKVEVGTPLVQGTVKASVVSQLKGKKLHVSKYKAKTGYRRKVGFRPLLTKVKIEEISMGKAEEPKKTKKETN